MTISYKTSWNFINKKYAQDFFADIVKCVVDI